MTNSPDPFLSSRRRIGRAREHIATLAKDGLAFWESKPYEFFSYVHPGGLTQTYKCRLVKPVPDSFHFLVIEAVEHLRAALDHIGYATAVLAGEPEPKSAHFPVADTDAQLQTNVINKRKCKDIPKSVVSLFVSFQPYRSGNGKLIWALNRLCNIGKHRFVTEVGLNNLPDALDLGSIPQNSILHIDGWDREKNEVSYFSTMVGVELAPKLDATFVMAFAQIDPVKGKPVIPILEQMADMVANIVNAADVEIRRLGLI